MVLVVMDWSLSCFISSVTVDMVGSAQIGSNRHIRGIEYVTNTTLWRAYVGKHDTMQFDQNDDDSWNVWMRKDEVETLIRHADGWREEIALRLMSCGLRAGMVPEVCYGDVARSSDGEAYLLRLEGAKDTTGSGGKSRLVPIPDDLERMMWRYADDRGLDDDESLVDCSKRTVQRMVERAGESAAEETGDRGYARVSAHDLRRYFGHHSLVVERLNPRVVMQAGGWATYSAIEPYLNQPTEEHMVDEMSRLWE